MTRTSIVLIVALLAVAAVPAPAAALYEADRDHGVASETAISEYQTDGNVTGSVTGLDMSITVADTAGGAGLTEWTTPSAGRVFLRVDYDEELKRTVRFYLPAAYVSPQLKQGLQPISGNTTADLEPAANRNATAVTVTFDGPTTAVFPISVTRGAVSEGRSAVGDIVANVTGVTLPSLTSGGAEWHYLSQATLADNKTDYITTDASTSTTIQYNAAPTATEDRWVPVPDCDGSDTAVCTYSRADYPNRTYFLSTVAEPPRVRYREGSSVTGGVEVAINDAWTGVERLMDDISNLFGGE